MEEDTESVDIYYEEPTIHIGSEIRRVMEEGHYSAAWLAAKLFCDRTNVYKILARSCLDSDTLYKISFFLRYDFFALYSREISRIKTEEDRII